MSAYRFCRTDDIPLLVDAWNRCGLPHVPGQAPLTIPQFKQEIRELDLWCSSCMVAFDSAKQPVAVLHGCKRPPHTLVHRIAVHPDHLRQGHGRHMLTSLSAKLAILGPPQLVAEIPAENTAARALFAACGWREDGTYIDYVAASPAASAAPPGLVVPVTVDELAEIALPAADAQRSWERSRGTILNRKARLSGLAIAHGNRLDASVIHSSVDDDHTALWNVFAAPGEVGHAALGAVLRELAHRGCAQVMMTRLEPTEIDPRILRELRFVPSATTVAVAANAHAA